MGINLFGGNWLHRAGHTLTGIVLCFGLVWAGVPITPAWLIGCEVIPRLLESLDAYAGGIIVTWEQRKVIWKRAKERGFRLSDDSIQDLWEYRLAWLLYPLAVSLWGWM